jgi:hypothetical protein
MTEGLEHIDELFRSKLSDAQVSAPSGMMEAVQNQLTTGASQQAVVLSTSSFWGGALGLKIAGVTAIVGISIGGVLWMGDDELKQVKTSPEKKEEIKEILTPEKLVAPKMGNSDTFGVNIETIDYRFVEPTLDEVVEDDVEELVDYYPASNVQESIPVRDRSESRINVKNESFEMWVLVVMSTVKADGAESALPSYLYPRGVDVSNSCSSLSSKLKGKGKEKNEDGDEGDLDHHTLVSTVILNWTYPESDWILFSDMYPTDPYIGTKIIDSVMKRYIKNGSQPVQEFRS